MKPNGYCMKCKGISPHGDDAMVVTQKNNVKAMSSHCPTCNTRMYTMISNKDAGTT